MKDTYVTEIIELLQRCDDLILLDLILKMLEETI